MDVSSLEPTVFNNKLWLKRVQNQFPFKYLTLRLTSRFVFSNSQPFFKLQRVSSICAKYKNYFLKVNLTTFIYFMCTAQVRVKPT